MPVGLDSVLAVLALVAHFCFGAYGVEGLSRSIGLSSTCAEDQLYLV